jgi:L-ascorbate metabolism protein UlaG (beta-lactamase superfamily)
MIKPLNSGASLAAEIKRVKCQSPTTGMNIWWLGQSGFLIVWNGKCLLLDPYLSDSLTTKYAGTDKPHVRMSALVISPELLEGIDIVTSSHNHTDHLDAQTLLPVFKNNPHAKFLIPEANREFVVQRLGCSASFPAGITDRQSIQIDDFEFTGLPAAHNEIERDENGNSKFMSYIIRFGSWTVFHSGDTLVYPGLAEKLKSYKIDVAFLPINGNVPSRGVAGNMDGAEAAALAGQAEIRLVIPHHYHLFEFNTVEPDLFESACKNSGQAFYTMKMGEGIELNSD